MFQTVKADTRAALSVDEIVKKTNHMALYQGFDGKGKVTLVITDKQGRTRQRAFNMLRKDVGADGHDQMYFAYFLAPADVRKMVFMVHKHTAPGSEDDRWLYMPSLDLVKRIAAGDKRTSFVGSDFLYEDISGRNIHEDHHELVETTDKHYVLKNTPKQPKSVEFAYSLATIDRNTFLLIQIDYYKTGDRLYRAIETKHVEHIHAVENGENVVYPTIVESMARDLETGSTSVMTFSRVQYNLDLEKDIFTERYLRRPSRKVMR